MKCYVTSGTLKWVGNASSPENACHNALQHTKNDTIDPYFFYVSERGFRTDKKDWEAEEKIETDEILEG